MILPKGYKYHAPSPRRSHFQLPLQEQRFWYRGRTLVSFLSLSGKKTEFKEVICSRRDSELLNLIFSLDFE